IAVVLDTDRSHHSVGSAHSSFEASVKVAASVGLRHIKNGFTVALHSNESELVKPSRGPSARFDYLDALARVDVSQAPLADSLFRLAKGRRDIHAVIVTSHLDNASAARIAGLISKGASALVVAVEWEESDPATLVRAREVGAQVVKVKPGAAMAGV